MCPHILEHQKPCDFFLDPTRHLAMRTEEVRANTKGGRAPLTSIFLPSRRRLDAIPASQQFSHFDLDIALKSKDFDDKLHDQWSAGTAAFLR